MPSKTDLMMSIIKVPFFEATDGSIFAEASIELLICWKFPYSYDKYFPDEAVKV